MLSILHLNLMLPSKIYMIQYNANNITMRKSYQEVKMVFKDLL